MCTKISSDCIQLENPCKTSEKRPKFHIFAASQYFRYQCYASNERLIISLSLQIFSSIFSMFERLCVWRRVDSYLSLYIDRPHFSNMLEQRRFYMASFKNESYFTTSTNQSGEGRRESEGGESSSRIRPSNRFFDFIREISQNKVRLGCFGRYF